VNLTPLEIISLVVGALSALTGMGMTLVLVGIGLWGMFSGFASKKETEQWRVEVRGYFEKLNGRVRNLEDWRKAWENGQFVERKGRT
jgi:hypothetical protein